MPKTTCLSIILLLMMALSEISCSESTSKSASKSASFERTARKQMETTFSEIANDPSSVSLSHIKTVYSNDSLCIVHCNFSAKNVFGTLVTNKYEYIYIHSNGKNYESYMEIVDNDAVYVSPEKYEKEKKGTIYEKLHYDEGIRYLATIYVNVKGKEVGAKEREDFFIPVPMGTGSWMLKCFLDEFGEQTSHKYLFLLGSGLFSNSYTTNSNLTAGLFIDDGNFSFKLVEYDSYVVKTNESYIYRIKDSIGDVYEMRLRNDNTSGQMSSNDYDDYLTMKNILAKGGIITVSVKEINAFFTPDTYLFKMNVTGYNNAKTYLK